MLSHPCCATESAWLYLPAAPPSLKRPGLFGD